MKFTLIVRFAKVLISYATGYPLYAPDSVSIIVTNRCNLKCLMCDFWKDNVKFSEAITLEEFRKLFKDLKKLGVRMVQFTGGEPFLRNDLLGILRVAKSLNLKTTVVTNGTLINERNVLDFVQHTDLIYISLDAPFKEQHEAIRGITGIFDKIISSAKLLLDTINSYSLPTRVIFCSTITPQGIHDPAAMVELLEQIGAHGVIYNPASSVYYGNTVLRKVYTQDNTNKEAYNKMIDKIFALMGNGGSLVRSNPFYLAASKEFLKGNKKYYQFSCFGGGYNGPLIGFDGTVFPCCAWNTPIGNIKEQSFSEIWKSKNASKIRKKIKQGRCPVCHHHTRTFDFIWHAPFLFKNPKILLQGYRILNRIQV